MSNQWISHVKAYASENNVSYANAMKEAKATYSKGKTAPIPIEKKAKDKKVKDIKVKKERKKKAVVEDEPVESV